MLKKKIDAEKIVCQDFLTSVQEKNYEYALTQFSEDFFTTISKQDLVQYLNHLEDSFGSINRFEMVKFNSKYDTKSSKTLGDRAYYYVLFCGSGDTLQARLSFRFGNGNDALPRIIDYLSIDCYENDK